MSPAELRPKGWSSSYFLFPKLDQQARNVFEIAAIARDQRDGTDHTTCGHAQIVCGPSDLLFPPFLQQRFRWLSEGKKLDLAEGIERFLE
jgi:hypothetical protein